MVAIIYILPTLHMRIQGEQQPTLWPKKKINLGLDLQGGMHLVLEVDTEKAVESTIERIVHELRNLLRKKRIKHMGMTIPKYHSK